MSEQPVQADLFDHVLQAYADAGGSLSNDQLYRELSRRAGIDERAWTEREAVGTSAKTYSLLKRRVRWMQQSLRNLGLLDHAESGQRGHWSITPKGKGKLTPAAPRRVLLGFSTRLGLALWSGAESVFPKLDEPITLCLTSPPFALAVPRAYGNPSLDEYVGWLCSQLEPIVKNLLPGGVIALNVSNDIFLPGSPARAPYQEMLLLALYSKLSLYKMDQLVWRNITKPPAPVRWASITRQQLNVAWEPIYILTNDPINCKADNRRVLQEHTQRQLDLIRRGGEQRTTNYGDGAYRLRHGSYANETPGRIPRNVLDYPHRCADKQALARMAKAQGLPVHGATMPLKLAKFLVEYLSDVNDLVVDPFGGWFRTAKAAEMTGRRWVSTEKHAEYVLGGANGFRDCEAFELFGSLAAA